MVFSSDVDTELSNLVCLLWNAHKAMWLVRNIPTTIKNACFIILIIILVRNVEGKNKYTYSTIFCTIVNTTRLCDILYILSSIMHVFSNKFVVYISFFCFFPVELVLWEKIYSFTKSYQMEMTTVVRGFVMNSHGHFLMVKHVWSDVWVLPWGHLEQGETFTRALKRELFEEFDIQIQVLGAMNSTNDQAIMMHPLPISIHEVEYFSPQLQRQVKKLELWYFAKYTWGILTSNKKEIKSYDRKSYDQLMSLKPAKDIHRSSQDILEQNVDLLELIS